MRSKRARLNLRIPAKAIEEALERLADRRQTMSLVAADEEVYHLLRDGVPVDFDDAKGRRHQERVRLIDFDDPVRVDDRLRDARCEVGRVIRVNSGAKRKSALP